MTRKWHSVVRWGAAFALTLFAALTMASPAASVTPGAVLDQSNWTDGLSLNALAAPRVAQVFTAGISGALTDVEVRLSSPNGAAVVRASITTVSGGRPDMTSVLATSQIVTSMVPWGTFPTLEIHFTTPAEVVAGTQYALVLEQGPDVSSCISPSPCFFAAQLPWPYAGGGAWAVTSFSFDFWWPLDWSFIFRTYVVQEAPKVVVSFGDSIAAGEGSGDHDGYPNNPRAYPARLADSLSWDYYNFAVSGACVSTAVVGDPKTEAHCDATKSIMTRQIPEVLAYQEQHGALEPDLVTVTIGANDIFFSQCFQALLLEQAGEPVGSDPCSESHLRKNLDSLENNLAMALARVHGLFPDASVALTGYFRVFPVTWEVGTECFDAMKAFYILRAYNTDSLRALAGSFVTGKLDAEVADFANDLNLRANSILGKLNSVIARVTAAANATFVPLNFTGHDFCQDYRSGTDVSWVFAPRASPASVTVNWSIYHQIFERDLLPTTRCVPQPDCNVKTFAAIGTKVVKWRSQTVTFNYSLFAALNDFPHLTPSGQDAVAAAIQSEVSLP